MNKNTKGFTLVELLGTVILLGVIALISVPTITKVIKDTNTKADLRSAQSYVQAAENFYTQSKVDKDKKTLIGTNVLDKLEVSDGTATGSVVINDQGQSNVAIVINNKCYSKSINQDTGDMVVSDDIANCGKIPDYCFISGLDAEKEKSTYEIYQYTCDGTHFKTMTVKPERVDDAAQMLTQIWNWVFDKNYQWNATTGVYDDYLEEQAKAYLLGTGPDPWGNYFNPRFFSIEVFKPYLFQDVEWGMNLYFDYTIDTTKYVDVEIPSQINGYNVERIRGFEQSGLKSVSIPDTVTDLGDYAFRNNELNYVKMSANLTAINNYVFYNNKLESIEIPPKVTLIDCGTFKYNSLTSVYFPDSVTHIGREAFEHNKISNLRMSTNANIIERNAFGDNMLPEDQAWFDSCNYDGTIDSTTLGGYGGAKKRDLVIPDKYTTIDYSAFEDFGLSGTLTLPSNLQYINDYAFMHNKIEHVIFPSSLKSIGQASFNDNMLPDDEAFLTNKSSTYKIVSYGGARRDNIVIPSQITEIGFMAFSSSGINSITIPSTITKMDWRAFEYNNLTSIVIPDSIDNFKNATGAFQYNKIETVVLPSTIVMIPDSAFKHNNIKSITIPESVTTICGSAFTNNDLTSITLPQSLYEIDGGAFMSNKLTSVTIPSSVMTVYDLAFANNPLTSVTIKGKEAAASFTNYGVDSFGWAPGYSNDDIKWNG